ncbi:MAG: hypothetical protein KF809_15085 [Chloroflexi bacterium]|nr:hypothetical protein [Chloroflexota bacterium]
MSLSILTARMPTGTVTITSEPSVSGKATIWRSRLQTDEAPDTPWDFTYPSLETAKAASEKRFGPLEWSEE